MKNIFKHTSSPYNSAPDSSTQLETFNEQAKFFLSFKQKFFILVVFATLSYIAYFNSELFIYYFLLAMNMSYITITVLRSTLLFQDQSLSSCADIKDDDLPQYSIISAIYKESSVLKNLVDNLKNIDYPPVKLQVLFAIEKDDTETINALKNIPLPDNFQVILVPLSHPRTKPKACNYALKYVTGKYTVIYDAEDKPDRLQLKKALNVLKNNENIVCVQARLNFYNKSENWLTSMFSAEYYLWFNRIMLVILNLNLPAPLGGSSNHFKTDVLKNLGGWDKYNMTEDADIGIRIYRAGYKIKMIDSLTLEEAPINLYSWLKQRSRWIKGFLQTYFVHMRNPMSLYRDLGFFGFITFSILIGIVNFLYILMPITMLFQVLMAFNILIISKNMSNFLIMLNATSFISGVISLAWSVKSVNNCTNNIKYWYTFPFYFLLHPIATLIALKQIFTDLHFWDKTSHGLSKCNE